MEDLLVKLPRANG